MAADFQAYLGIVFENTENTVQSWHIDGHTLLVGINEGQWSSGSRSSYSIRDTISRSTVQVYPNLWIAVYMPLDNVGMWSIRSAHENMFSSEPKSQCKRPV